MTPLLGTFSAGSVRGSRRMRAAPVPVPTPEYWWRADSGISTSGWTAYAGGLNFNFVGVTSANSSTGVLLAPGKYGSTANIDVIALDPIEARHIFVRHDSWDGSGTLLGGSFYGIHAFYFQSFYIVEGVLDPETPGGVTLSYASQNGVPGTKLTWVDFINSAQPQFYHDSSPTVAGALSVYVGSYTNRFQWPPSSNILLGVRQQGISSDVMNGYIKEVAIFTTPLTIAQGQAFQANVMSRWP